jgi:hypothetical protein
MNRHLSWRSSAALAIILVWAARGAAQTVVVGTGDPNIDVPAVQAAVDQGGEVILAGPFSFNSPPTVPMFGGGFATVLVSKAVLISGTQRGEITTIDGGTTPFYVDAPGASVTIQGLRFVRPKRDAIFVYAVSGLTIAACRIDGIDPALGFGNGIDINTIGSIAVPTPTNPGKPENISGTLSILNNDINLAGGTAETISLGVVIYAVGVPAAGEVEVYVSGNRIRNTTEPAIALRRVGGRAFVERNVIRTGSVVAGASRPQAIRVGNTGSFLIAHNTIDCGWVHPDGAQGIGVFSQLAVWPMQRALVTDNDINMSAPEGTIFGPFSAAIGVFGFAQDNVVLNNRIRGRARAALSVPTFPLPPQPPAVPANNAFVLNTFDHFEASVADIFVDNAVMSTLIVGQGTVEDHGVGTVIVRLPDHEGHHEDGGREQK